MLKEELELRKVLRGYIPKDPVYQPSDFEYKDVSGLITALVRAVRENERRKCNEQGEMDRRLRHSA